MKLFHFLGRFYTAVYKIPILGNWIVRGICRTFGLLGYPLSLKLKQVDSIDDFIPFFKQIIGAGGIEIEITQSDVEQFEFTLTECPYGFSGPEHAGVCDAAMDMDRTMFGLCGFGLTVKESIPGGSSVCREQLRLKHPPLA